MVMASTYPFARVHADIFYVAVTVTLVRCPTILLYHQIGYFWHLPCVDYNALILQYNSPQQQALDSTRTNERLSRLII